MRDFNFLFSVQNFYAQSIDELLLESDKSFAEFNNQASLDAALKADKKFPVTGKFNGV